MEDRPIAFCTNCDEKKEYVVKAYKREITVKGITFSYVHQTAYCSECGEELYCPQINDANVQAKEDAYRKAAKLITVEEVNQILEKYCIGAGPLAKVLGMGEITINRYVGGQLPSRENSAKLLDVLASPQLMEEHLESNKALISSTAYKKCRRALDKLLPLYGDQKIEIVTRYILGKSADITPLALQKLLYYAQSFYYALNRVELFTTPCQAWQHGPVYPSVYFQYREYGADPLDKPTEDLAANIHGLSSTEVDFLDCIIDTFGRYSGSFLRNMTHNEAPWKEARGNLAEDDRCTAEISRDSIHRYFDDVVAKYSIHNPHDLHLYVHAMTGRN